MLIGTVLIGVSPAGSTPPAAHAKLSGLDALPSGTLAHSPSLYLREAADSPVRWQPWGKSAFALARRLHRPMLIEVGAAWCHWCHVMDQTTYADPAVAELINANFVPVKVDTDERPDINNYYQSGAAYLHEAGGWPLTCFATGDGELFLAMGYVPPRPQPGFALGMASILKRIAAAYARSSDREALQARARSVIAGLERQARAALPGGTSGTISSLLNALIASMPATYDRVNGGFRMGNGARFYNFPLIEFALAHGFFGRREYRRMALESLEKMAAGGVYDQLGGGFHRYSTDPAWRVPHFEKMLADQAMAMEAYTEGYQVSNDPRLASIARSIAGYVNSVMLDPKTGAFYSQQDADAHPGDDGDYYTWTRGEIANGLTSAQAKVALLYFGFDDDPAIAPDGRIVLRRAMTVAQLAARMGVSSKRATQALDATLKSMRMIRSRRPAPRVDHAVLVDRNALMADAYLRAAAALGDPALRRIALDDLNYLIAHARARDGSFYHVLVGGVASVPGLVADQVYMMGALADAWQATGDRIYLRDARVLARLVTTDFRAPSGLLRNRVASPGTILAAVPAGPEVFFDTPTPSVQASAALALATLSVLTSDPRLGAAASALIAPAPRMVSAQADALLGTLGLAMAERERGAATVTIVGSARDDRTRALERAAWATYRPWKVVMLVDPTDAARELPGPARAMFRATKAGGSPLAFVCVHQACARPASTPGSLAHTLREFEITAGFSTP